MHILQVERIDKCMFYFWYTTKRQICVFTLEEKNIENLFSMYA